MGYRALRRAAKAALPPLSPFVDPFGLKLTQNHQTRQPHRPSRRPTSRTRLSVSLALTLSLLAPALVTAQAPVSSAAPVQATAPGPLPSSAPASDAKTPPLTENDPVKAPATPASKSANQGKASTLPTPSGFDPPARSRDILAHLSAVIRFYRLAVAPIQKVGEPSDLLYREQAVTYATQIASYAFQSAKTEASLIERMGKASGSPAASEEGEGHAQSEAQRLQATRTVVAAQLDALKDQDAALSKQVATARAKARPALQAQVERVEGALELQTEMYDSLGKIAAMADSQSGAGLVGDVDRLQRSAPELADTKTKTVAPPLESLSNARNAGVSSQASVLFQLLATRRAIDEWSAENNALGQQAKNLRTPLITVLRATIQQGQALAQQASSAPAATSGSPAAPASPLTDAQQLAGTRKRFDALTTTFKALSAAAVPLSQEILTLDQNRANLIAWRAAVNTEYTTVLRDLLLRVLAIALALGVIFALGEVWRRATTRYVHDIRRRRQILVLRRLVIGFLTGIVLIFGTVTQFTPLATFAGFITAGLAVGLQTILLSVAAYFFIIGRYGVRVGDRITVAGVTGDVIDVGLVRFYMLEMAGSATDLHPTGRVAVFSNSVLFQAGTPLYKQMPGTEYAWHELTVKLTLTADYRKASAALLQSVQTIYERYRPQIERQHGDLETWMDASIDAPKIESHLQLVDDGLQFWVRFPVEIRDASSVDEEVTNSVLQLMAGDEQVKSAVAAAPVIKAVVKG